ncbi:MAG TPA: hypothetical protein PKC88_14310, partial [Plasticicumulans sp.]|nr:hypothetical protein [Plasticicumulans sp.]
APRRPAFDRAAAAAGSGAGAPGDAVSRSTSRPPVLLAALAQLLALFAVWALQVGLIRLFGRPPVDAGVLLFVQGLLAAALGLRFGLPRWWIPIQIVFLPLAWGALTLALPPLLWLALAAVVFLIFRNSALQRVPLYLSGPDAWAALAQRLPRADARVIDLGCGLGGPLLGLARQCPQARIEGIESAPLPWLCAWLRCLREPRILVRYGDFGALDLGAYDLVFCFLSPQPMLTLWLKARAEMRAGSLFASLEFPVPDLPADEQLQLPGGRTLYLWRL